MEAICKFISTFLTIALTIISCIFFQHRLPKLSSVEDPIFHDVLDQHEDIHCPRNFSLYLLSDGTNFYHVQTRTDPSGMRTFERCEMSLESSVPWQREVPVQTLVNGTEHFLKKACEKVAYEINPTASQSANDIVISSHVGEEEVTVEETEEGLITNVE